MKHRIADVNTEAEDLLPPKAPDGSGIGVNYTDAFLKSLSVELEDGRKVSCKRKGLKLLFAIGDAKGEALMRRLEHGPDAPTILHKALEAAASAAGVAYVVEDGVIYLQEDGEASS
ncbi:MAG: hypothetical protein AAF517_05335 [Planctomycetota bacterium]